MNLGLITLKERVFLNHDLNVEIAGRTATGTSLAFSAQLKALPMIDTGWNLNLDLTLYCGEPRASTILAGITHDLPEPATNVAGAANREEALLNTNLPCSAALSTRLG